MFKLLKILFSIFTLANFLNNMKFVAFFLLFFISCGNTGTDKDLRIYRESALNYLVQERVEPQEFEFIKSRTLSKLFLPGWFLIIFQADNVDRSRVTFKFSSEQENTKCGLYIREKENNQLLLNLMECEGPYSNDLSGEYGLEGITVSINEL